MILGIIASVKLAPPDPGEGHRYWRLFVTSTETTDSLFCNIAELSMQETASGPNVIAGSSAVTASSSFSGFPPTNAVDGDVATMWSSDTTEPTGPSWLRFDMGGTLRQIDYLKITAGDSTTRAARAPSAFKLQWSDDDATWNDHIVSASSSGWGGGEERTFEYSAPPVGDWIRFDPTGAEQTYTVPAGKVSCEVHVIGAGGGGGMYSSAAGHSGAGGYSHGTFAVTAGETLKLRPGGGGKGGTRSASGSTGSGGLGGWPGGGSGAWGDTYCGGGGGYSGIFRNDGTPLVIAGGGGGGTGYSTNGGAGGGTTGGNGNSSTGGTQSAGGSGSYPGSAYQGGNANAGNRLTSTSQDCGGGGGGYFGGGAPGGDGQTGSGGSGFIGSGVTGTTYAGTNNVRPAEIPSSVGSDSTAGLAVGILGSAPTDRQADPGGNGAIWIKFT
ncbi:minor tail protein [Stenotrophomonas phage Sonora]|nr:minor tail protein [Stenotrophomonas phage Sonora]